MRCEHIGRRVHIYFEGSGIAPDPASTGRHLQFVGALYWVKTAQERACGKEAAQTKQTESPAFCRG